MKIEEILSRLENSKLSDENEVDVFIVEISSSLENLELDKDLKEKVINRLLCFIERQENEEFISWSLIHFIEWLDEGNTTNYTSQVLESLERKPTYLALILLNRIINSETANLDVKDQLMQELKRVTVNPVATDFVQQEAMDFYERQLKNL
ncbi:hypothetical protein [Pontibacter amylolyticus]|uniref:Immunity protein 30 domain-containing protein n=1 Tax=Pontibacter amylolyticus TaxID=1424080 RepID=A0ABQ1WD01_9BACT|nr:hypothetical protein [Pontibacter amylolyticus]GGG26811.1 hypothetical protein GCM10011323_33000 [Pontibacter amylolyticus]